MKMIGNVSDWLSYAGGALIKVADSAGSTVQVTRTPLTSKVRGVLVTCFSNIDFLSAGNQLIMQKW